MRNQLNIHVHNASQKLRHWNGFCSEIGVILRSKDFQTYSSYSKLPIATNSDFTIRKTSFQILSELYRPKIPYRSVGIELKKLSYNTEIQQSLFDTLKQDDDKLSRILDKLEQQFGKDIVKLGQ